MTSDRKAWATAVGIVTALAIWFAWGAWQPLPAIQDEYSYVLQSRIFARGHWTEPPPPVQYSFQQAHVLTKPRLASKYPPGHALLMAPGAFFDAPWLVPLILSGFAGALVFLLAERFYGTGCALFAWACWLTSPINLRFRPGYYSEMTSSLSWLVTWWLLLDWLQTRSRKSLVLIAVAIGWCAITRPLTALAFALPVGTLILWRVHRERRWKDLTLPFVVGALIVAILPISNKIVTGKATLSPFSLYRAQYLPFDHLGFGLDSTPPTEVLAPVNSDVYSELVPVHIAHTLRGMPRVIYERLAELSVTEWGGWRMVLLPLVLVGLIAATAELWFAIACGAALFIVYLSWAHWHGWIIYYFEALPVIAFSAAAGLDRVRRRVAAMRQPRSPMLSAIAALVLAVWVGTALRTWHGAHVDGARYDTTFHKLVDTAPFAGVVVFVRYGPDTHPHTTVVNNSPTLATDRVWVVNDNPSVNMAVLRAAGGRVPMLYDERGAILTVYRTLIDSLRGPNAPPSGGH